MTIMENNTRKIVVLNNLSSSKIEQAIFILRDEPAGVCSPDAVTEAQRIVDMYLTSSCAPLVSKKKRRGIIGGAALFLLSFFGAAYLIFSFIR